MFIGPAAFLMPLIIVNVFSSAIGNKTAWEFNNVSRMKILESLKRFGRLPH